MQENPWVYKDNDYLSVWVNLLLSAVYHKTKKVFGGSVVTLLPGQLITGRKELAKMSKVSESKVERILKRFKIEQQIEQASVNNGRLITIKNWERYQESEQQSEQPVNNERTASEQPVNTIIRNKEIKNIKKERTNTTRDELFDTFWSEYPNRSAKANALKAWTRLTEKEKALAIDALPKHKSSSQWVKDGGLFIPHAATWLNQKRFLDEVQVLTPTIYAA